MNTKTIITIVSTFVLIFFSSSCVNKQPFSEFVKTINFSNLDSFIFSDSIFTGLDFRSADQVLLESLSQGIITDELSSLGFKPVSRKIDADFYVLVTWRKALSYYSNPSDHIDPYAQVLIRKDNKADRFTPRLNLILEIYNNKSNEMFWRKELPNIFNALQITEKRVADSLKRAIKGFPARIIKDPNLPSIQ